MINKLLQTLKLINRLLQMSGSQILRTQRTSRTISLNGDWEFLLPLNFLQSP